MTTLYKRNAQGKPIFWDIDHDAFGYIIINHGLVGKVGHKEVIKSTRKIGPEIISMINAKRKEGYKELIDLYDNAPKDLTGESLRQYLNLHLPKYNTHEDGKFIPMLCKTLQDNKPFEKGSYFGQWKINGERCIITATRGNDLFQTIKLFYRSREGVDWTDKLSYLDEYLLPCIEGDILDMMIEEGVGLDGELYLPGYSINEINSFIKNVEVPQHYKLQYWCYDLCIENMSAVNRAIELYKLHKYRPNIKTKEDHLSNKSPFVVLPNEGIFGIKSAIDARDRYIDLGFEGLVIREESAEYQFGGKRNNSMLKFKKKLDGLFTIIAINEDKRGLPVFTLKNDINDETFDATLNATQEDQKRWLYLNPEAYGTIKALVEYRERSGVKEVPFHAKIIKLSDK